MWPRRAARDASSCARICKCSSPSRKNCCCKTVENSSNEGRRKERSRIRSRHTARRARDRRMMFLGGSQKHLIARENYLAATSSISAFVTVPRTLSAERGRQGKLSRRISWHFKEAVGRMRERKKSRKRRRTKTKRARKEGNELNGRRCE